MKPLNHLLLAALAATSLVAAGCGDEDKPCDGATCGANAHCDEAASACVCDDGFSGDPSAACVKAAICHVDTCGSHGICSDSTGVAVCSCNLGYTGERCASCDFGYTEVDGACVRDACSTDTCNGRGTCSTNASGESACTCDPGYTGAACDACAEGYVASREQPLTCVANPCATETCNDHGECSVGENGQAACTCATGWSGTTCDACDDGYGPLEGDCVASPRTVSCNSITPPANATQVTAEVQVAYVDGAWETPADCEWTCDEGFSQVSDLCVQSQTVPCASITPPANGHQIDATVTINYVNGEWETPEACEWACNSGFGPLEGACLASPRQVSCVATNVPANASPIDATVSIAYVDGAWETPAACEWTCDSGFGLLDGACVASPREVACAPITPPASAHQVDATVSIAYVDGAWETPEACEWACNDTYGLVGNACLQSQDVACTAITPPANAQQVDGTVTIHFVDGAWETPDDCAWECESGFGPLDGACVASPRTVSCNSITPPANATQTTADVQIAYVNSAWETPADCAWACDSGFGPLEGACVASPRTVPCNPVATPANGSVVTADVQIAYEDGAWAAPADCQVVCNSGFHRSGSDCLADIAIDWCQQNWPNDFTTYAGQPVMIFGQVYAAGSTNPDGYLPNIVGMLCYSATPITTTPIDVAALTCVDSTYNTQAGNNDEHMAIIELPAAGTYSLVFAFSGNGGTDWTWCDHSGVVDNDADPAVAVTPLHVTASWAMNGGFEGWNGDQTAPLHWTPDSGVGVAIESTLKHSGNSSVKLTRNGANGDTDLTSTAIPVVPGTAYRISMWFLDTGTDARGRQNYLWLDANGTLVGAIVYGAYSANSADWQEVAVTTPVAPANAAFLQLTTRVYTDGGLSTGGFVYLDDVTVTPQ